MPIYMDVHIVPGVKAKNVAEAHQKDLILQAEHGCKCMTYWIDEERGNIFCLVEAPFKEAVEEMHSKAHGLIPNKIIEVKSDVVESFLGRIYDPEEAKVNEEGLKVFSDPSFRILLFTRTTDPKLLLHKLGAEQTDQLLTGLTRIIRKNLAAHGGREAENEGSGFIITFSSANQAVSCASAIQEEMYDSHTEALDFRIAIHGGEPVGKDRKLFGDTIRFADNLFSMGGKFKVAISSVVKELVSKDFFQKNKKNYLLLPPKDERLLELLYSKLEAHWQDPDFDMTIYCQSMAMSKSQLYRKTVALTGLSPNLLLKEFRLEKAKEMMKKQYYNIAQITFDSGFTSASYFTKCFKKKYGLLPMTYLELLH